MREEKSMDAVMRRYLVNLEKSTFSKVIEMENDRDGSYAYGS